MLWRADWDPQEPIHELMVRLEECYIFAVYLGPTYTKESLIKQAHLAVKNIGLYRITILEWESFDKVNKTLLTLKAHLTNTYGMHETSRFATAEGGANIINNGSLFNIGHSLRNPQAGDNTEIQTTNDNVGNHG